MYYCLSILYNHKKKYFKRPYNILSNLSLSIDLSGFQYNLMSACKHINIDVLLGSSCFLGHFTLATNSIYSDHVILFFIFSYVGVYVGIFMLLYTHVNVSIF